MDNNFTSLMWLTCILNEILHGDSFIQHPTLRGTQQTSATVTLSPMSVWGVAMFTKWAKVHSLTSSSWGLCFCSLYWKSLSTLSGPHRKLVRVVISRERKCVLKLLIPSLAVKKVLKNISVNSALFLSPQLLPLQLFCLGCYFKLQQKKFF